MMLRELGDDNLTRVMGSSTHTHHIPYDKKEKTPERKLRNRMFPIQYMFFFSSEKPFICIHKNIYLYYVYFFIY